ncbi:hypothetical protein F4782DRAFT_383315 [Xylaria castorea]|nr:hypothetical protein F4782DRAFT_383315 [Xylaria castorea]
MLSGKYLHFLQSLNMVPNNILNFGAGNKLPIFFLLHTAVSVTLPMSAKRQVPCRRAWGAPCSKHRRQLTPIKGISTMLSFEGEYDRSEPEVFMHHVRTQLLDRLIIYIVGTYIYWLYYYPFFSLLSPDHTSLF